MSSNTIRTILTIGAGALLVGAGYIKGQIDAMQEKSDKLPWKRIRDDSDYRLKNDVENLVKKTEEIMTSAKDKILNSKEFDNFSKSLTKDELMHILCNSQVFDTVVDILKENNGEFRPGYYFKKDEWKKYEQQYPDYYDRYRKEEIRNPNLTNQYHQPYQRPAVYGTPNKPNNDPWQDLQKSCQSGPINPPPKPLTPQEPPRIVETDGSITKIEKLK